MHIPYRAVALALLVTSAATGSQSSGSYYFSTLAGSPAVKSEGSIDGPGYQARFNGPYGIAIDGSGNLFVADNWNRTIRKITPDGTVSTFAGTPGVYGSDDGIGRDALFGNPWGLTVDPAGNVFVADAFTETIRKITPDGTVTTVAGMSFIRGYHDGPAKSALFKEPAGLAVDAGGNIYVADSGNRAIRKITAAGEVTTIVQYPFQRLGKIALDPAGNLLAVNGNAISRVTLDGKVTTFAGLAEVEDGSNYGKGGANWGTADGQGEAARFNGPYGLAVAPDGAVYVADTGNNTIRKITSDGVVTTLAGLPAGYPPAEFSTNCTDGPGRDARFFEPNDVVVAKDGTLYVADTHNNTIRKITPDGEVTTLAGVSPFASVGSTDGFGASARFASPHGTAVDGLGNLYVADSYNHTIRRISPAGAVATLAGTPGRSGSNDGRGAAARFYYPKGVAADQNGNVYVCDTGNHIVRRITPDGTVTTVAGTAGIAGGIDGPGTVARFNLPQGITVDGGILYVVDTGNHAIRRIADDGTVTTVAGAMGMPGAVDGAGASARFSRPEGVAVDSAHNLYVADTGNYLLRRITPDGNVSTLAGSAGLAGASDGPGAAARFMGPEGVAVDASGAAFVVDNGNYQIVQYVYGGALMLANGGTYTIRRVSSDGLVSTIAGQQQGAADGLGSSAQFDLPYGIAVDRGGALYVSCSNLTSNTIRKGVLAALAPSATRLANVSTRAYCSAGNRQAIGGFVVSGRQPKQILIRAVGPSLTAQGIDPSEVLADPAIELHRASGGDAVIARNDDAGDNPNAADVIAVEQQVGAAPLLPTDRTSSALLTRLEPGVYTFVVSGKNGASGIVLIEAYDADTTSDESTFVNLSTRAYSTAGNAVTIGGLVISGTAPKRVLLRAVGPTLATQGLGGEEVLSDPAIELHDARHGNAVVAVNDDWTSNDNTTEIRAVGARIGATPFDTSDTHSSALLLTLQPGIYTFVASGKGASSGIVLVEAYDAD